MKKFILLIFGAIIEVAIWGQSVKSSWENLTDEELQKIVNGGDCL